MKARLEARMVANSVIRGWAASSPDACAKTAQSHGMGSDVLIQASSG